MRPSRRPAPELDGDDQHAEDSSGRDGVCFVGRFGGAPADVAELVDALVSGTSGGNIVGVQVSPSALL